MKKRVRLVVHGRMQGVCFRMIVKDKAEEEGIPGWIRNLPDGSVEAVFERESSVMDGSLKFCRRVPPFSRVDHLDLHEEQWSREFDSFPVRH